MRKRSVSSSQDRRSTPALPLVRYFTPLRAATCLARKPCIPPAIAFGSGRPSGRTTASATLRSSRAGRGPGTGARSDRRLCDRPSAPSARTRAVARARTSGRSDLGDCERAQGPRHRWLARLILVISKRVSDLSADPPDACSRVAGQLNASRRPSPAIAAERHRGRRPRPRCWYCSRAVTLARSADASAMRGGTAIWTSVGRWQQHHRTTARMKAETLLTPMGCPPGNLMRNHRQAPIATAGAAADAARRRDHSAAGYRSSRKAIHKCERRHEGRRSTATREPIAPRTAHLTHAVPTTSSGLAAIAPASSSECWKSSFPIISAASTTVAASTRMRKPALGSQLGKGQRGLPSHRWRWVGARANQDAPAWPQPLTARRVTSTGTFVTGARR